MSYIQIYLLIKNLITNLFIRKRLIRTLIILFCFFFFKVEHGRRFVYLKTLTHIFIFFHSESKKILMDLEDDFFIEHVEDDASTEGVEDYVSIEKVEE